MTTARESRTLVVLGGTGRTGRSLIEQALARGHRVRALARRPEALPLRSGLEVIAGDARDPEALGRTLRGADAVLSVLGPVKNDPAGVMTAAAEGLLAQMPAHGVARVVALTGAGVAHPGDRPRLPDRVFGFLLRRLQPQVIGDSERFADLLRGSGLDWTLVRAPMLRDGPPKPVRSGLVGDIGVAVTRDSVAHFMLDVLEGDTHVREAPAISN